MKKQKFKLSRKTIFSTLSMLLLSIIFATSVFAEGDTNMTGVDETVGKQATSDSFKWAGTHAQGIRVTIVNGESGVRISPPIDYTNYKGKVDVSYEKATKLEYKKEALLDESTSKYTSMTPPTGMPTVLFNTSDGTNNMESVDNNFTYILTK